MNSSLSQSPLKMLRCAVLSHEKQIHLRKSPKITSVRGVVFDNKSKTVFLTNNMGRIRIH